MKKLVVMADNHGDSEKLELVRKMVPHAAYYIHCGDSEAYDMQELAGYDVCVAGNNDWSLRKLPRFAKIRVEGVDILITHGQFYGWYNKEKRMIKDLKKHKCTVMIAGHTHMPEFIQKDRYTFINPGSTTFPRGGTKPGFCVVTIDQGKIDVEFIDLSKEKL